MLIKAAIIGANLFTNPPIRTAKFRYLKYGSTPLLPGFMLYKRWQAIIYRGTNCFII